jgi:hypothetical protein
MPEEEINNIFVCEYLITLKQVSYTNEILKNFNTALETYGYEMKDSAILLKKKNETIGKYNIEKIFHTEKENVVYIIYELYAQFEDEIQDDVFESIDKNLLRFKKDFYSKIKDDTYTEDIFLTKDDYSAYFLRKSYPIIFNIENSLRELLFKTMTYLANKDWEKEFNELVQLKEDRKQLGIYGTDFSHLSKLLFDKTGKSQINNILEEIKKLTNCDLEKLKKLQEKLPKSNWEKHFSKIEIQENIHELKTDIYRNPNLSDTEVISKLLEDLNKMRNKVAHNNIFIDINFYDELYEKSKYLLDWIEYSLNYIEEKMKKGTKDTIRKRFNSEEKKLYEKLSELIDKVSKFYKQDKKDIFSFLKKEFRSENNELNNSYSECNPKCIRDIIYFMKIYNDVIYQHKEFSSDNIKKNLDDISELIKNFYQQCPHIETETEKIDFSKRR